MRLFSSILLLPALRSSELPVALALPTLSTSQLANAASFNTSVLPVNQPKQDMGRANAGAVTANVSMNATEVVVDNPGTPKVANHSLSDASSSSSSQDTAKTPLAPVINTTPMTTTTETEELSTLSPAAAPPAEHIPAKTTENDLADEATSSCSSTPSQNQAICTTSAGSQWSFDLSDLIGLIFGLAQTVLAVWPAMVAWQYLQEHRV